MKNDQRVARLRVFVKARRHQDVRAEVHIRAVKLGEPFTADANVLDVLSVFERRNRRDLLIERERDRVTARADGQLDRLAINVAGLGLPLLTFAAIGWQLDDAPVGEMEGLVAVEQGLHCVLAGLQLRERPDGIAEGVIADAYRGARLPVFDVGAEDNLGVGRVVDLQARLGRRVRGQEQQQAPVQRPLAAGFRKSDCKISGHDHSGRKHDCQHQSFHERHLPFLTG